mgnify:CR=1 FL=1
MRQESAGVTEALLDSARREFMEHGFHGASLRRISADSGVSTNSIYTRFGDKAGLFAAVVGPVADGLMEYYLTCVQRKVFSNVFRIKEVVMRMFEYIYQHFDVFYLIFCRSAGTEYEQYFDRLAQIEETYYRAFADKYAKSPEQITDFFVHVICRTGWQYIYEIVSHKLPFEEAKVFMDNIKQYRFAGWKAVLGHE